MECSLRDRLALQLLKTFVANVLAKGGRRSSTGFTLNSFYPYRPAEAASGPQALTFSSSLWPVGLCYHLALSRAVEPVSPSGDYA